MELCQPIQLASNKLNRRHPQQSYSSFTNALRNQALEIHISNPQNIH